MEENDLKPETIEKIVATPHPIVQFKLWQENSLRTEEDYSFYAPFLLACAAYKINKAHWLDEDVRQDPRIRDFMERVKVEIVVDEKGFGIPRLENPEARSMAVEVIADGRSFKKRSIHIKGLWQHEESRNTDEELIEKFSSNSSRILSSDQINKAAHTILDLDRFETIAEVMKLIAP